MTEARKEELLSKITPESTDEEVEEVTVEIMAEMAGVTVEEMWMAKEIHDLAPDFDDGSIMERLESGELSIKEAHGILVRRVMSCLEVGQRVSAEEGR